jgi:hypothetical protein
MQIINRHVGTDFEITTVNTPQGIWTLVAHAHGWDRMVTPGGVVISGEVDTRSSSPEAEVINFILASV